jgi:hypothetical protein
MGKDASGDPACGLYYQLLQQHNREQDVWKGTGKPLPALPKPQWFFGESEFFLSDYALWTRMT